jgi:hypothetical protein
MRTEDQLNAIKEVLQVYADPEQGGAFIASDPAMMWEMAYNATNKLRLILCCIGEAVRGDFSVAAALARVDREFVCMCTRGRSFDFRRNALSVTVQNTRPMFRVVAEVRDIIRSMLSISQELPVDYKGFKSFPLEKDWIADAYMIEFSLATDLPLITSEPPDLTAIGSTIGVPVLSN